MPIRQPICTVLGHIDHGKTSLLDKIRGTAVQLREAGGITQHIGASFFPTSVIEEICGELLEKLQLKITIPGLLIIDTPGHHSFLNLRRRGGAIADIAILVIDILSGFQPQTFESINILKARKCPFLVAANKIDRIPGWKSIKESLSFMESYKTQDSFVQKELDNKVYEIMGDLSREGFTSDRFEAIRDFTKSIAIIPTSAKSGEGIPELLMVLIGLTQQYMLQKLQITEGPGKGVALEVKEEPGLGTTIDAIIYDGIVKKGDLIVVGGIEKPIETKIRALLLPKPLDEIRDPREKFSSVKEVSAAAGIKISAAGMEEVLAGAPIIVVEESKIDDVKIEVMEEIEKIRIVTDKSGVILKSDTLGSLEAIVGELKGANIPIRLADVGDVSKREVIEASIVGEREPLYAVILAFNVSILPDAKEEARMSEVKIFEEQIIYQLVDEYKAWFKEKEEELKEEELRGVILPGKIQIIPGYIFRKSKPAIVGVEVLAGSITPKIRLINEDGKRIGEILQIQSEGENIQKAGKGEQVAISIRGPIVDRHIHEEDILFVDIAERNLLKLREMELTTEEKEIIEELTKIKRKTAPYWGL